MEYFTNQQDIKTKTLNWCHKLQQTDLLTTDQFNQCITTFNDDADGTVPKNFKTPQTGMSRNYSLYNTKSKDIDAKINNNDSGETSNTNKVMLSTNKGMTLACKNDNTIYLVLDINDSSVIQNELYFTLVPHNTNTQTDVSVYSILSPYGKYLVVNTDYDASFTGISTGTIAKWNISKITTSNEKTDNNIMLESSQYSNHYLIYDDSDFVKKLKITQGKSDDTIWSMKSKQELNNNDNTQYNKNNIIEIGEKYKMLKESLIQDISKNEINKICITELINTYNNLSTEITDIFTKNIDYINNYLTNQQKIYISSNIDYQIQKNSIIENNMISLSSRQNIIKSIPLPLGLNIANNDIPLIINKIKITLTKLLSDIQNNKILPLQKHLDDLNKPTSKDIDKEFSTFLSSLNIDNEHVENNIKQNNAIIDRQNQEYNKINNKYNTNMTKLKRLENVNIVADVNNELNNKLNTQHIYKKKLYLFINIILLIIIIYFSYYTFIKFKQNIL